MTIRKFKNKDAKEVCKLVTNTFNEFVANESTHKGIKKFLEEQTSEQQVERTKIRYTYVAVANNKIVGFIEAIPNNRITKLFVNKNYQKKGIGRRLVYKIENLFIKNSAKTIKVRSSFYAQKFYEKLGYKRSSGVVIKSHGISYQPMKKSL